MVILRTIGVCFLNTLFSSDDSVLPDGKAAGGKRKQIVKKMSYLVTR
ncbi:hypothetical protein B0H98_101715 [Vreelandella songnenensis]|uniref:Uncharacterized protein n=1 Tax=Vreelandella songnenensis TaxID=1176243 RepID=A0A2T0V959_9GAMM|nr:hypothetical protein B0H98_101715 [Halomonas songnenensis]